MTVACGLTPGASGSSEASLTHTLVVPTGPGRTVGRGRRRDRPIGTVEQRCTVITLARLAENVACIVARSDRRRTTRCAAERRVDLGGAGLEHEQRQAGEAAAEQRPVATGQAVGDQRIAQARDGHARAPRPSLVIAA